MGAAPDLVDPRGARLNQGVVAALLLIAFVINWPLVIPAVATVLLFGSVLGPRFAPVLALYAEVIGPRLAPPSELEDPRSMRFNDVFGAAVLAASTAAFVAGYTDAGWGLALLMAILAGFSAVTDVCVGCRLYHAVSPERVEKSSDGVHRARSQPLRARGSAPEKHPSFAQRWRARWVGLRVLGGWVTVVDQTADGKLILRAGSDRFLLSSDDRRLWPLFTCTVCRRAVTSLDTSQRLREVLCHDCKNLYTESAS